MLIQPTACTDAMSGESYETTVTITLDGRAYHGCGGLRHELTMRKTLIISGAVLALLLLLLVLLPVLFGGRIAERVKTEANRSLNARVDWRDAGLSLSETSPTSPSGSTISRSRRGPVRGRHPGRDPPPGRGARSAQRGG